VNSPTTSATTEDSAAMRLPANAEAEPTHRIVIGIVSHAAQLPGSIFVKKWRVAVPGFGNMFQRNSIG
jgi:hypothetical protein